MFILTGWFLAQFGMWYSPRYYEVRYIRGLRMVRKKNISSIYGSSHTHDNQGRSSYRVFVPRDVNSSKRVQGPVTGTWYNEDDPAYWEEVYD